MGNQGLGNHAIEGFQLVAIGKLGVTQCVTANDLKIFHAMQKQIHAGKAEYYTTL